MAVPIRVLWNLKISFVEKISIGLVFIVGIITMVTAIIRSVSLESSTSAGQVSTTWLMLVRTFTYCVVQRIVVSKCPIRMVYKTDFGLTVGGHRGSSRYVRPMMANIIRVLTLPSV